MDAGHDGVDAPGAELRVDPVTGIPVIVAPGRSARPHTTARPADATPPGGCPFCPGNEHETPPEVLRTGEGADGAPGWRVRVVPNLYPIVGGTGARPGATGAHEVVILSPDHDAPFGALDDAAAIEVLTVLRDRVRAHLDAGHAHAQALINHGRSAGASIAHPHAQVIAVDVVPPLVLERGERAEALGTDPLDLDLATARAADCVVDQEGGAIAWCPPASGWPWGVRIAHATPRSGFEAATDAEVAEIAVVLRRTLARLTNTIGPFAHNVIIHTAVADIPSGSLRWSVEVVPRLGVHAGFELGTGILVNPMPPEAAASALRASEPTCTSTSAP
jgi:UDPglucose--hexose-1-phosphate uridylyltransferase